MCVYVIALNALRVCVCMHRGGGEKMARIYTYEFDL